MNVIGSRPDGWWRDPDVAMVALIDQLQAYAESSGDDVSVVFDWRPPRMHGGRRGGVSVGFAKKPGPNAADKDIVRRVQRDGDPESLIVVTSDRKLAEKVRSLGAAVEGAKQFRSRLEGEG